MSGPDRGPPSALRGWLSDIYYPALLSSVSTAEPHDGVPREQSLAALAARLGPKATVDDPLHGRATGLPGIPELLAKTAAWLGERGASYTRTSFTLGVDRDVTEGALSLTGGGESVVLPVAIVAERRKSREVEVRLYFSMQLARGGTAPRAPIANDGADVVLPPVVGDHVDAMRRGDVAAALAAFEQDGVLRDARGRTYAKADGSMKELYTALLAGGVEQQAVGSADDGRICAIEHVVTRARGQDVSPRAGLAIYERGDSGLLRALRLYDDRDA